jgi:PAT family beta-lactamase induction signal transducer AmpG
LRRFGGRKAWIVICSTMMIVTLLMTATVDFVRNFNLLIAMIVLNNFFCATQDVAIDSLAVSTLKEEERGRGNGFMFGGQYSGIAMGGGGTVAVYGIFGFSAALFYVCLLQFICLMFVLFFVRETRIDVPAEHRSASFLTTFGRTLADFLKTVYVSFFRSGRSPKLALLLSVLPTGALVLQYGALTTIQVDYGLTELQIARLSIINTLGAAAGCVIGGLLADRFGLRKMLGVYYLLTAIPGLLLATLIAESGLTGVPPMLFQGILASHGILYGMIYGARPALFMGVTNPAVAATQFTAFMAMANLVVSYTNFWQGVVAGQYGYAPVLLMDAGLIVLGLTVIPFVRSREEEMALAGARA